MKMVVELNADASVSEIWRTAIQCKESTSWDAGLRSIFKSTAL